jgi:hypothetical protein
MVGRVKELPVREDGVCRRDMVGDKGEPEGEERPGLDDQVLLDLDLVLGVLGGGSFLAEVSIVIGWGRGLSVGEDDMVVSEFYGKRLADGGEDY